LCFEALPLPRWLRKTSFSSSSPTIVINPEVPERLLNQETRMWEQKRSREPYYWAAFQIQGEWK